MADYYTQSVFDKPVLMTEDLASVMQNRGAEVHRYNEETVLDGIVHGRPPLSLYGVTFDEGWNDLIDAFETLEAWADDTGENLDDYSDEWKRLAVLDEPSTLYEILKLNPEMEEISLQSSFTCSKMRLDGFGGSGLVVNRKGYLYITTTNWEEEPDGTIVLGSKFVPWEESADVEAA